MVAEMDGSVWQNKVGAFRLIPYFARRRIELPSNIVDVLDISEQGLRDLLENGPVLPDEDLSHAFEGLESHPSGGELVTPLPNNGRPRTRSVPSSDSS